MSSVEIWTRMFSKTRGRFFSVSFRKQNGQIRKLNGKVGRVDRTAVSGEKYVVVFDVKNNGWRKVNINTIRSFKCAELSL